MSFRDRGGRFASAKKIKRAKTSVPTALQDHSYYPTSVGCEVNIHDSDKYDDKWIKGRRLVEFDVLLSNLKYCHSCRLGPVPLTYQNLVGELQKGLGGYLYVKCENCKYVNRVAYGKTHHDKRKGMPCFDVNTKLGTAMIDSLGGPVRVNNFLASLNLKPISDKNLKQMEERAGKVVESLAKDSAKNAAKEAFSMEMKDIADQESSEAQRNMNGLLEDLGVCPLPDASPSVKLNMQSVDHVDMWTDDEDNTDSDNNIISDVQSVRVHDDPLRTPVSSNHIVPHRHNHRLHASTSTSAISRNMKSRASLTSKFPCPHTFFMSKSKYGKKVV